MNLYPCCGVPDPVKPKASNCKGFRWIGQPWSSCDGCGLPYWEHDFFETLDRENTLPFRVGKDMWIYNPISEASKKKIKKIFMDNK